MTGIGGLFFKSKDPKAAKEWYKIHLDFNTDDHGYTFWWKDPEGKDRSTQWNQFAKDTNYYKPSKKEFMFNTIVENLRERLKVLKDVSPSLEAWKHTTMANSVGSWRTMATK